MPAERLPGRVVLVTGASSGIGAAAARAFVRAGARVVLTARRAERLAALASELGEAAVAVPADLADPGGPAALAQAALERCGRVDILVNNAGLGWRSWFEQQSEAQIEAQLRVNLAAPLALTRQLLPAMLARRAGHVIFVASAAGLIGTPSLAAYSATKFGLRGLAEALRREAAPYRVAISVLSPGPVAGTEFGRSAAAGAAGASGPAWLRLSAEAVAQRLVALAARPRPEVIVPWPLAVVAAVNQRWPALIDWALAAARLRPAP